MRQGCAWIIGIILLVYAINNPEWLWFGGILLAIAVVWGLIEAGKQSRMVAAAVAAKAAADAAFLNSIPDSILPALGSVMSTDMDPKRVPKVGCAMPAMSQNVFKYHENTGLLTAHVDYLDGRHRSICDCVEKANGAYKSALDTLQRQQADLYRLAFRASQNVASIEARFPGFDGRLDEVRPGWVPPAPPVPNVYGRHDHAKAMHWLAQVPSVQIAGALGRGDWRAALLGAVITAAVKVIQFQKILRAVTAAHETVTLAAKQAVDQRRQLSQAYERLAHISQEVHRRSVALLGQVAWFAEEEGRGGFSSEALSELQRQRLIEMGSYAHLGRLRAGQAA